LDEEDEGRRQEWEEEEIDLISESFVVWWSNRGGLRIDCHAHALN